MIRARLRVAVGVIAAVAFAVRILHVLSYDPAPTNDMAVYVEMALKRLSLANLFRIEGICWFPPGYAFFLKPFFMILEPQGALRAVQAAQAALGAWTCVLLYRLGRRIGGRKAGLAAAVLTCFFPHFVFYTSVFMSETLFTALYVAALLLFMRSAERPGRGYVRAGLAAAAAVLVRPAAASLFPAALLAAWRAGPSWRARGRALALVAAGGAALILPWAARNWIAYGRPVLIAPNAAFNLAIGNHAEATGTYTEPPSIIGDVWAREEYFRGKALDFVTNDPWGALFVALRLKWKAFWQFIPPWPLYSSNPTLYLGEHFFPFVSWRAAFVLGLAGAGVLIARKGRGAWATPACFAAYVAFYLTYFGHPRFRLPAEAILLAWAGVAVEAAAALVPRLARARAQTWAGALAVLLPAILVQSSLAAAGARAYLRDPASIIAAADQIPVIQKAPPASIFGEAPIPLDRSRGRYVMMSFTAFRQGPHRDTPNNGSVRLVFLDPKGNSLPWLDNAMYYLEALPADRWVTVRFKAHIPPGAAACRVVLTPDRGSPDTLILDQPILRYARGNDLALEFLFPYLRYEE